MLNLDKRGQLSDVMSWIVATLVIIGILTIFIFGSSLLAQKTKVLDIKIPSVDSGEENGVIEIKNLITYQKASEKQKEIIDNYFLNSGGSR